MHRALHSTLDIRSTPTGGTLLPPAWVETISGIGRQDFFTTSRRIERAHFLSASELSEQVMLAYLGIFDAVQNSRGFQPVRFWNFIPNIHEPIDAAQSRYMIFNAGRYRAFVKQFGDCQEFDRQVPTASAVGHNGNDLWIHCLASRSPGIQIGNPRQISPHFYSSRFGKLPPSFARATLLKETSLLLIGGTASILGEESLHNDLEKQTEQTLSNLSLLIESASGHCKIEGCALDCMTDVRIYHPRRADVRRLKQYVNARLRRAINISMVHADLCRPELLVEIEGVAELEAGRVNSNAAKK